MRLDLFSKNDKVLLLGEGNFSFSVCLFKQRLPIQLFSTCFEKEVSYQLQEENVKFLRSHNVPILFNVDATKLHENSKILDQKFDKIVFNFPHVGGKMKIHLNRELLRNVFESSSKVLEEEGQMIVSLCGGQGGTPADNPQRSWSDSWQVTEMAAHGDFVLVAVEPFIKENFSEYQCIGYRSQDVKFNLKGALVHVFSKRKPPFEVVNEKTAEDRLKPHILNKNSNILANIVYSELYERNPFLNPNSSISFLKNLLINSLKEAKDIKMVGDDVVPLYVEGTNGAECEVTNVKHSFSLREYPTEIIKNILESTDHTGITSQIIIFPGVFFNPKFSEHFSKKPPVSLKILIIGCDLLDYVEKYLSNLVELFKKTDCVTKNTSGRCDQKHKYNLGGDCFFQNLTTVLYKNEDIQTSFESCELYSLRCLGRKVDACTIHIDSICEHFFKITDWREVWALKSEVLLEHNGIPVLRQMLLYPSSYEFDLTFRYTTADGFIEEKFIEILWMAGGMLIQNVQLLSHYTSNQEWSSKCYRITYSSLDYPLYRNRVIEIHSKIVGKMLEKGLNVIIS